MRHALLACTLLATGPAWAQTATDFSADTGKAISSSKMDGSFGAKHDTALIFARPEDRAALMAGTLDAQPMLQAAAASGSGWVPCGTYRLDRPLTGTAATRFSLDGAGSGCVRLRANFPAGDIVQLTQSLRPRLTGMVIEAGVTRTSGAVVHFSGTYGAVAEDVPFEGPHGGDGYLLDAQANTTHIDRWDCRPPVAFVPGTFGAGACIHGTGNFADLHIGPGNAASWHYCVQLTHGSGVYTRPFDCVVSGNALLLDPSAALGQSVYGATFLAPFLDTSAGDNLLMAGDGVISNIKFSGLWASNSQTANGIAATNPAINGVQVDLADVLVNHGAGITLLAGRGWTLTNIHAEDNGVGAANTADGVFIGPGVSSAILMAGRSGHGGTGETILARPATQRWGVYAPGGSNTGQMLTVIGVQTRGNLTGSISLPTNAAPNTVVSLGNGGN